MEVSTANPIIIDGGTSQEMAIAGGFSSTVAATSGSGLFSGKNSYSYYTPSTSSVTYYGYGGGSTGSSYEMAAAASTGNFQSPFSTPPIWSSPHLHSSSSSSSSSVSPLLSTASQVPSSPSSLELYVSTLALASSGLTDSNTTFSLYSDVGANGTIFPMDDEEQMDENIYIMPVYQQIIWSVIFGTIVLLAAGGNLIVIWIVLINKRMRTVTNYFLVNLSVADIMVSTLNVIFNFIYMLDSDWPFGELYCKVTNFNAILSVAASVFTLMAISIDRYLAIVHPLRPRMSRTTTVNIIIVIWIASCLLSLPNIIYSTTQVDKFKNGDTRVVCLLEWYDGISTKSRIEYIYNVLILLVTYVLPIVSMSFTYFRVGRELWGSQSIGECTAKQMENTKSKRKIVKMMMIVVAIFGICWAPYHIYFLLIHQYPQIIKSEYVQHVYLAIYWLAMSNSVYNPFVYCWMNSRFRQGFRNVLCCECIGDQAKPKLEPHSRYHGAARYSCASEACTTIDTRVRFNGNGNMITLQPTTTNTTGMKPGGTGNQRMLLTLPTSATTSLITTTGTGGAGSGGGSGGGGSSRTSGPTTGSLQSKVTFTSREML